MIDTDRKRERHTKRQKDVRSRGKKGGDGWNFKSSFDSEVYCSLKSPYQPCSSVNSVLQCVAVWCSVLQCVAVCCSVLQCVAVCCSVVQSGAVC